jgi:SAM-dependent methyltransferase
MPGDAVYWDDRYRTVGHANASWFQHRPLLSLRLIEELDVTEDAAIVDVGGGASALVDCLVDEGFVDVTVVDLSQAALDEARERIPNSPVEWIQGDIRSWVPTRVYDVWHDRAAYHFLTEQVDQQRYWQTVRDHLHRGGHLIVATFAPDGPESCSGLPVQRYSVEDLAAVMGEGFRVVGSEDELHHTPGGGEQSFTWVVATRV